MELIVILNCILWFIFYCILFIAFIGWYIAYEKMHSVSDLNFNWLQEQQIFAASFGGPDLFKR
jgi:hypothetical protein